MKAAFFLTGMVWSGWNTSVSDTYTPHTGRVLYLTCSGDTLYIFFLSVTYSTDMNIETMVKGVMLLVWSQYDCQLIIFSVYFWELHVWCRKNRRDPKSLDDTQLLQSVNMGADMTSKRFTQAVCTKLSLWDDFYEHIPRTSCSEDCKQFRRWFQPHDEGCAFNMSMHLPQIFDLKTEDRHITLW